MRHATGPGATRKNSHRETDAVGGRQLRKDDGLDLRAAIRILNRHQGPVPTRWSRLARTSVPVTGSRRALVLLVDFTTCRHEPQAHFDELLFSLGSYPTGSMRDFYQEASYGQLDVIGIVMRRRYDTRLVPGTASRSRSTPTAIMASAATAERPETGGRLPHLADANVNFADYDNDGDGVVDALVVVCAGSGAEQTGNVNDIWSHKWDITPQARTASPFRATHGAGGWRCGAMAHELGHC
jgi:immune inhibitor A